MASLPIHPSIHLPIYLPTYRSIPHPQCQYPGIRGQWIGLTSHHKRGPQGEGTAKQQVDVGNDQTAQITVIQKVGIELMDGGPQWEGLTAHTDVLQDYHHTQSHTITQDQQLRLTWPSTQTTINHQEGIRTRRMRRRTTTIRSTP